MLGQLWQPCPRCHTEPVCVTCEHCEGHCTCIAVSEPTPEERTATAGQQAQAAQERAAQKAAQEAVWEAFEATLPPQFVMCEGNRRALLTVGERLDTPQPPAPAHSRTYFRATTPAGRQVLLCSYGNATIAHGEDDALDEIVTAALILTPRVAFGLLANEIAVNELDYQHTGNRDVGRILRVLGREEVIRVAQSERIICAYTGSTMRGEKLADKGQKEAEERYGLDIEWVEFGGYTQFVKRHLLPEACQDRAVFSTTSLYQAESTGQWYIGNSSQTHWVPISHDLAALLSTT